MFDVFPWRQESEPGGKSATASEERQIGNNKETVLSVEISNEP